jgi:hypothetical protein
MNKKPRRKRILALDIRPRRFGFVVLEEPNQFVDWGVRRFPRGAHAVKVPPRKKLAGILDEVSPAVLVLSDRVLAASMKKYPMVAIAQDEARRRNITIRAIQRVAVKHTFPGQNRNKDEIASAITKQFPELAMRLPPKRKLWQSEDHRMSIFVAAGLGIAYIGRSRRQKLAILPASQLNAAETIFADPH